MNDRELLALAAKAAGYQVSEERTVWGYNDLTGEDIVLGYLSVDGEPWNPLEDDGDALRLAVKLDLIPKYMNFSDMHIKVYEGDAKLAETRRAIVRSAAALAET